MCSRCDQLDKFGLALMRLCTANAAATDTLPDVLFAPAGDDDAAQPGPPPPLSPEQMAHAAILKDAFTLLALINPRSAQDKAKHGVQGGKEAQRRTAAHLHGMAPARRRAVFDLMELIHDLAGAACGNIQLVQDQLGETPEEVEEGDDAVLRALRELMAGSTASTEGEESDGPPPEVIDKLLADGATNASAIELPPNLTVGKTPAQIMARLREAIAQATGLAPEAIKIDRIDVEKERAKREAAKQPPTQLPIKPDPTIH